MLVSSDLPFIAQIYTHRRIDVCLQAPGHVVETAIEGDLAGPRPSDAGNELDPFGDFVPGGEELVGRCALRGFDSLDFDDKGVEFDDLLMTVEHINGELTRNMRRDRGDGGENGFLLHGRRGFAGYVSSSAGLLRKERKEDEVGGKSDGDVEGDQSRIKDILQSEGCKDDKS